MSSQGPFLSCECMCASTALAQKTHLAQPVMASRSRDIYWGTHRGAAQGGRPQGKCCCLLTHIHSQVWHEPAQACTDPPWTRILNRLVACRLPAPALSAMASTCMSVILPRTTCWACPQRWFETLTRTCRRSSRGPHNRKGRSLCSSGAYHTIDVFAVSSVAAWA